MVNENNLQKAAEVLKDSKSTIAFTGAGISVESGVPPFRGENGIWNNYDPKTLELDFFADNPKASWVVIRELFYKFFGKALPNRAHKVLSVMEKEGILDCVITQNIDNLHQMAGSKVVHEFHGNSHMLSCTKCGKQFSVKDIDMDSLPPGCSRCNGIIKPGFVFFGENIPAEAYERSVEAASKAEVVLLIGSTGEVYPAAQIPHLAKQNGAVIIEVNTEISNFTNSIVDFHLEGQATNVMNKLYKLIFKRD